MIGYIINNKFLLRSLGDLTSASLCGASSCASLPIEAFRLRFYLLPSLPAAVTPLRKLISVDRHKPPLACRFAQARTTTAPVWLALPFLSRGPATFRVITR